MSRSVLATACLVVIACLLLLAGDRLVLQRSEAARSERYLIRGDTGPYVLMSQGGYRSTPGPYRYRVLVPYLAGLLPFSSLDSLKYISYASLLLSYILFLSLARAVGFSAYVSVTGLLCMWSSAPHLYNFHNPFYIDAPGLLVTCALLYLAQLRLFVPFCVVSILGVLVREQTILVVLIWFGWRNWKQGWLVLALSIGVLVCTRWALGTADTGPSIAWAFEHLGVPRLRNLSGYVREIFQTWGFVWLIALAGVWLLPERRFAVLTLGLAVLVGGAVLTSLIATDLGRMFMFAGPALALACSAVCAQLLGQGRSLDVAFLFALTVCRSAVSLPTALFPDNSPVFGTPMRLMNATEILFALSMVWHVRRPLSVEISRKFVEPVKSLLALKRSGSIERLHT